MAGPEPFRVDRGLGQRQQRTGGDDPPVADDDRAIMERRTRREDRAQQIGRHIAVDHDASLRDFLQPGLTLKDDERALTVGRQGGSGPRHLDGNVDDGPLLRGREQPAERADATDAFEGTPQFGLEDHNESEQADDGAALQDLRQQAQVDGDREGIDKDQDTDADHQTDSARPSDQAEQPVDEERRDPDVDDRRQVDLVEDRSEELGHRRPSVASRPAPPGRPGARSGRRNRQAHTAARRASSGNRAAAR